MCTASRINRNRALAVWTDFGGRSFWSFLFLADSGSFVDGFHQAEQNKCHDDEIDNRGYKCRSKSSNICQCVNCMSCKEVKNRIDKVVRQRCDDTGKGTTDDNTDCHIHDIASEGECLKFLHELFHTKTSCVVCNCGPISGYGLLLQYNTGNQRRKVGEWARMMLNCAELCEIMWDYAESCGIMRMCEVGGEG